MRPETFDIVIVGAGIIGCSIAWEFAQRGATVLVMDKESRPFKGVSQAAFGSLSPFTEDVLVGTARNEALRAVSKYRESWVPLIQALSKRKITFRDLGHVMLLFSDEEAIDFDHHLAQLIDEGHEPSIRYLTTSATLEMEPHLSNDFKAAVWFDEPWIDVDEYYAALSATLTGMPNVYFQFHKEVAGIQADSSGVGVFSVGGDLITGQWIVVCAGLGSIHIPGYSNAPLRWTRGDAIAMYTPDNTPILSRTVSGGGGFITPRANGRMLLGYTHAEETEPVPKYTQLNRNRISFDQFTYLTERNLRLVPSLVSCEVGEVWRGWRPTTFDGLPLLGPLSMQPRVILAAGYFGFGVTMAPIVAEQIREYCMDRRNQFNPVFDPNRALVSQTQTS